MRVRCVLDACDCNSPPTGLVRLRAQVWLLVCFTAAWRMASGSLTPRSGLATCSPRMAYIATHSQQPRVCL